MSISYVTVDVFTERRYGGNPLAVVLDAAALSTSQMQAIAAEFNYSETTFVLPPDDPAHTARVRIFTPRTEMPFAGHPNVGTAFVLASRDPAIAASGRVVFEEKAGLVPVEILRENGNVIGSELTAPEPLSYHSTVEVEAVARCLSLSDSDIVTAWHQPKIVSVGFPFLVAQLASRDALRRAAPNVEAHRALLPLDGTDGLYVYTRDVAGSLTACDIAARMFAPLDGIHEDPATGSATGAAAALLAELDGPSPDGERRLRFVQGEDMGRTSVLDTRVQVRGGRAGSVHVGGRCVSVMEGRVEEGER